MNARDRETREWTVHLAALNPGRAALVLTAVVLAAAWALVLFGHWVAMVVTAGMLVAATSEFLFPLKFTLTAEYAEARGPLFWRRIEWKDVRRVYVGTAQIKLSPLPYGGPREAFRGVILRTTADEGALLEEVRERRAAARQGGAADEAGGPAGEPRARA